MSAPHSSSPMPAIAVFIVLMLATPCLAVNGINPDGSLDKPTISKAYFEGEFWTVINALEAFRKSGMTINREDSIYTFKYLSVVYAAEPTTRAKAESYMYQLIRMMPTIDLLDLYISDNIQSIFVKVKSDFEKIESHKAPTGTETAPQTPPTTVAAPSQIKQGDEPVVAQPYPAAPAQGAAHGDPARAKKKSRLKVWTPLAIGGVGLATATYFLVTLGGDEDDGKTPSPVDISLEWPKEGSR